VKLDAAANEMTSERLVERGRSRCGSGWGTVGVIVSFARHARNAFQGRGPRRRWKRR